jgi:hypothetical protein
MTVLREDDPPLYRWVSVGARNPPIRRDEAVYLERINNRGPNDRS